MPAALQIVASTARITCVPTRFGINLHPPLSKMLLNFHAYEKPAKRRAKHDDCPRASNTVTRRVETSNKSLDLYSLRVIRTGSQYLAANCGKARANGNKWPRTETCGTGGRELLLGNRSYKFAVLWQIVESVRA